MESGNTHKDIFLGFKAYSESDVDIFKGREQDSEYLYSLVANKDYVVCYAESGEGKSSLIEAGLVPRLKANRYFPVRIAFTDEEFNDDNINFDLIVKSRIMETVSSQQALSFIPKTESDLNDKYSDDMWWFLRHYTLSLYGINFPIVLIFDQFEEVMNYPKSDVWTSRFFAFLEKISSDDCPQYIMNDIADNASSESVNIQTAKDFKAVFSIRTEYIGELDYWCMQRYFIPDLKHNRFCLKPLTLQGAEDVMKQYEGFDEGLREIIKSILLRYDGQQSSDEIHNDEPRISALILSVVCTSLYHSKDKKLNAGTISDSIENFYNEIIENCNISIEERNTIASVLVDKDKRVRVASDCAALEKIGFNRKYKDTLLKNRLIKKSNVNGVEYIELVHDSLIDVVKKHKEEALQKELRKKRRRTASIFTLMSAIILLFVIMMTGLKKNEKNLLITQAKYIASEADKLLDEDKSFNAMRLLNYVANNNKESLKVPEFENMIGQFGIISVPKKSHPVDNIGPNCEYIPNRCMVATYDANILRLLSYKDNQTVFEMVFNDTINMINVSDNPEYIVLLLNNNEIILCSTISKEILFTKKYDNDISINELNVTPDGKFIFVFYNKTQGDIIFGRDLFFVLFSVETGQEVRIMQHDNCFSMELSNDGKYIVKTDYDNNIELYSVDNENLMIPIKDKDGISCVCISDDGEYMLTQDIKTIVYNNGAAMIAGDNVKLWSFEDKKCLNVIRHDSMVKDFFFTSDGKYIVTTTLNKSSKITSVETGECLNLVSGKIIGVDVENMEFITLSADNKIIKEYDIHDKLMANIHGDVVDFNMYKSLIVTNMYDEKIKKSFDKLWSLETGECIYTFEQSIVRFSPDGKYVAVAREQDKEVDIYSVETSEVINVINHDYSWLRNVKFSLDGRLLLLQSLDGEIEIWSLETNQIVKKIAKTEEKMLYRSECIITPNNDYVVLKNDEGVKLYSITNPDIKYFQDVSYYEFVKSYKFSPDGNYLAFNNEIISVDTKDTILSLPSGDAFTFGLRSVEFSADCKYIVASYTNNSIKVWSLESGNCICTIENEKDLRHAYFTKDGKNILSISDNMVRRIPIKTVDEILDDWSEILGPNAELTEEEKEKYFLN